MDTANGIKSIVGSNGLCVCSGSGSWRGGQHRPGADGQKDGVGPEPGMSSPQLSTHGGTASALCCSQSPHTDVIGT